MFKSYIFKKPKQETKQKCKHIKKTWKGTNPVCGWTKQGKFTTQNFMCGLLLDLREICELYGWRLWCNDQNLYVKEIESWEKAKLPNGVTHLLLSVHKGRGRTEGIWLLKGNKMITPSESQCKKLVTYFEQKQVKK